MNNKFKFIMPAELTKSDDGEWKVRGLASTQGIDQQGETIIQKGIDLTPIDQQKGILNWDHQKGPENTIGLLDGYQRNNDGLYVEGRLFKNHTKAKAVREIMASLSKGDQGRMGLSVEGQILERDPRNPKIIKKCRINAVALTMNPVNQKTYADLVKSMNGAEELEFDLKEDNIEVESDSEATFTADQVMQIVKKALGVGAGYTQAPNTLSGGDAMTTSDMKDKKKEKKEDDGEKADQNTSETKVMKKMNKSLYKSNMKRMLEHLQELYPGYSREVIWQAVKQRMETIFPDINDSYPEN